VTVDLLLEGGMVVTMDDDRTVYEDGAVAVDGREIVAVGPTDEVATGVDPERTIDASDHLVIPGLINAHVHVPDILYRSRGKGRVLHDWLFNVKQPFVAAMDAEDHRLASALYCQEALLAGTTTFVENAGGTGAGYDDDVIEAKLDVYDDMGVRNVYAHGFLDAETDAAMAQYADCQRRKEPDVSHVEGSIADTAEALDTVESLIESFHGSADGRQSVWPGPFLARGVSPEGLAGAYDIAERHDVMTTTHTAESPQQERHLESSVEYLESAGYLGEHTLLGHCVQVSEADIRRLAATDTSVAHNVVTNGSLGTGVAPIPAMHRHGVTVGLGTDNIDQNDTVNVLSDMRFAAMVHKAEHRDPGVIDAETVLSMATIEAARAIGRGDDLGSLEPGKRADVVALALDRPHLTPYSDVASALVYQARGSEITTVLCNGATVVEDGSLVTDSDALPDSRQALFERCEALCAAAGLDSLEG